MKSELRLAHPELDGAEDQATAPSSPLAMREILEREVQLIEARTRLQALERALAIVQDRERHQQEQIDRLRNDLRHQRNAALGAMREAEKIKRSFHYRFGKALIDGFTSFSGLAHFPSAIAELIRDIVRRKRSRGRGMAAQEDPVEVDTKPLLEAIRARGLKGAREAVAELDGGDIRRRAALLSELARLSEAIEPLAAIEMAREALTHDPRPFRAKQLAFLLAGQGHIAEPVALLDSLPPEIVARFKPSEKLRRDRLMGMARLYAAPTQAPPRGRAAFESSTGRVLCIASSAMPLNLTGYTRRTQALVAGTRRDGWDVQLATRPGYPQDRTDLLPSDIAARTDLGGVVASVLDGPSLSRAPIDRWLLAAADSIETHARALRPGLIHAPSNWQNALPALVAARRLGLPFVYDVRGFWEMTRISRQPHWARSEEHRLNAEMENHVARSAERVVTQSPRLADMLVKRGVERERIMIVPNGSDALPIPLEEASENRAALGLDRTGFWIGYVGSVVDYEGVDDLVRAVGHLAESGIDARAVVAGEGNGLGVAKKLAAELGIADRVVFLGTVPPSVGETVLAASDVVALPRHSFAVTDLVEPLKPAEAMALGRPLVASDVLPHRDVVVDGANGLLHRAGDARDLAAKLERVARETGLARQLAQSAAEFIRAHRRWTDITPRLGAAWTDALAAETPEIEALSFARAAAPEPAPAAEGESIVAVPPNYRGFSDDERRAFGRLCDVTFKLGGLEQLRTLVERQCEGQSASFRARCLVLAAAAAKRQHDLAAEMTLLEDARETFASPATWRPLARAYWYRGDIAPARALVSRLEEAEVRNPTRETAELRTRIEQRAALMGADHAFLAEQSTPVRPIADPKPDSAAYFLHFTLPYASNGYATRSHGLLKGIAAARIEIEAFSRAGFPLDMAAFRNKTDVPESDVIDGVIYHRLLGGSRVDDAELDYLLRSAEQYERAIRWLRPGIVHAASNYTTGLPALLAARRTGRPFIYEVRGFWEITRATRQTDFERNPQYEMIRSLENLVAREADRVITLTEGMRRQLVEDGVPEDRIHVVPNAVDPSVFKKMPRDEALATRLGLPEGVPVIGYVGSVVGYEGLDDLVSASALLRDRGKEFRILLVGDGEAQASVMELVRRRDLKDRVIAPGRVPSTDVPAYYSLIDICPFPRKPIQLCEIVSPLKPFEAMAMHKAVVASDVAALAEIVSDRKTGLLFRKGSVADLARALEELVDSPELRAQLGEAGRDFIERERSWSSAGEAIAALYRELNPRNIGA
ncbi:MAG TPA: glycosyltransferase [Rhizomicrobium sp.]|nr:glycosyltransferase [Rhizomicrobium sp.]